MDAADLAAARRGSAAGRRSAEASDDEPGVTCEECVAPTAVGEDAAAAGDEGGRAADPDRQDGASEPPVAVVSVGSDE